MSASCSKTPKELGKYTEIQNNSERSKRKLNCVNYCEVRLSKFTEATPESTAEQTLKTNETQQKYRQLETQEEKAQRQAIKREQGRKYYQLKQAQETPEQTAKRRAIRREEAKKYRQRIQAQETPEETAKRLLKGREIYKIGRCMETAEETAKRELKSNEYYRRKIEKHKMETPEQTAERQALRREQAKKYHQQKQEQETPEQTAIRRAIYREHAKNYRQLKKEQATPEQMAEQRLMERERAKKYRQQRQARETPEQTAERRARRREQAEKKRQLKEAHDTPEQIAERRAIRREQSKKYRQIRRAKNEMLKNSRRETFEANPSEGNIMKNENIDDGFDESCTWSSFGGSAGIYSQTTITTEDNSIMQYNSDATSKVKSERSQDASFFYEVLESDSAMNRVTENKNNLSNNITEIKHDTDFSNHLIAPAILQDNIVKEELDV